MPWNGSGLFTRLYNWTQDAAGGIKILASKHDAETNGIVAGLNNCLTLDGQNKPTANIDWNGKKITNLLAGTAATDAATVGQIVAGEWILETRSLTWLTGTTFKVMGADVTATYHPGRRIKSTNSGGTIYSTVTASTFSTDTTVTVVNDSGALDSGFTALNYGVVARANSSQPYITSFATTHTNTNVPSNATTIVNQSIAASGDKMGEWTNGATARFTAKVAGDYWIDCTGTLLQSGANVTQDTVFTLSLYKNGGSSSILAGYSWPFATGAASRQIPFGGGALVALAATDYVDVRVTTPTYTVATVVYYSRFAARMLG